jgi:hypothetical protein
MLSARRRPTENRASGRPLVLTHGRGSGFVGSHPGSLDFYRSRGSSGSSEVTNVTHHEPPEGRISGLPWVRRVLSHGSPESLPLLQSLCVFLSLSYHLSFSLNLSFSRALRRKRK